MAHGGAMCEIIKLFQKHDSKMDIRCKSIDLLLMLPLKSVIN